jgi:nucleotide-binding universal stress UspA family protein
MEVRPAVVSRVVVPSDGSAASEGILDSLEKLLECEQSTVVFLLRVLDREHAHGSKDSAIEEAQAYISQVERRFRAPRVEFEGHVRVGEPADAILTLSREVKADLIAMSTHGLRGVERWIRGSTAERVLRHASVSLMLVNPFDRTRWETGFKRILVPLDGSERSEAVLPLVEPLARQFDSELVLFGAGGDSSGRGPGQAAATGGPECAHGDCKRSSCKLDSGSIRARICAPPGNDDPWVGRLGSLGLWLSR